MPTVPEQLHQARLARHLTIQQVADITKIRTDHIRALEEGRYEVFSAAVYVRGFVRSYATLLKLDVPQVMAALDAELKQCAKFNEPQSSPSRRINPITGFVFWATKLRFGKRAILVISLIVLAGIIAGVAIWREHQAPEQPTDVTPGVYQTQNISADTMPLPQGTPRR